MSAVKFWMFGREFVLSCDDGQEPRLHFLVARLKERVEAITRAASGPHAGRSVPAQMDMLVMAAVTFADEFQDAREALSRLQEAFQPGTGAAAPAPAANAPGIAPEALAAFAARHTALQQRLNQLEARLENITAGIATPANGA